MKKSKFRITRNILIIFIFISILPLTSFSQTKNAETKKIETKKTEQKVTFNFIDVEVPAVIKFISDITGKNFIFDEGVKGKITIIAPTKLSINESFALFTSVLELKGFTVVPSGTKAYKIIPSSLAKQAGNILAEEKMPVDESYITRLLPLKHITAAEALKFLQPIISRNGHISAFGPGNLLMVVDSTLNIEKLMSILERIDQPPVHEAPPGINVYFLENADATDLAKVLDGIIKSAQSAKKSFPTLEIPFTEVTITPDKATNSLVIMASPEGYQNIVQVIKSLDKRKRQVYVEAMIIEASIDKLKELGVKWRATATHKGEPIVVGGFGTVSSDTLLNILSGLSGAMVGGMGNFINVPVTNITSGGFSTSNLTIPGFAALFSLSDFRDAINVLSTPQILTSDNEEAEIVVGENVPFISKRERDITTTSTVLSSIERKDVGITLKITPQITEGDYVKINLYQEISAVKEEPESIVTTVGPTTTKRSTKTSIVVKDSQTVVIGGLMQERDEDTMTKTPLLGDIPILGWLFKNKTTSKQKTNLLVFLTPHVIKDSLALSAITDEKHDRFAMEERHYVEGELLVKFKEGVSKDKAEEIISQKGASILKYIESINSYHIKLKAEQKVKDALKEFLSDPDVLYAEPNYKIKIQR